MASVFASIASLLDPRRSLTGLPSILLGGYVPVLTIFRYFTHELDNGLETSIETIASILFTFVNFKYIAPHRQLLAGSAGIALCQAGLAYNVWRKYVYGKKHQVKDLTGKVYIITGCNTGIGYETMRLLLQMNATIIMACRSLDRANEAKAKVLQETGVSASKVIVIQLDLSNFASVRKFVEEFLKLGFPLHALVNNAGLMADRRTVTKEGLELTFTSNHLGHFLLTNLLLPELNKTNGRIVNLTSCLHKTITQMNFDDIMYEKNYEMFPVYAQSKLANVLFTVELTKRLKEQGSKITCLSVHPGCVRTEITRHMNYFMQIGNMLAAPIMITLQKTPEQGGYGIVYAVTKDFDLNHELQGNYIFNSEIAPMNPAAKDMVATERLWKISEEYTGFKWQK